jgi:hypothetical protein
MPKYCSNCGAKLIETMKYCPECGVKIETAETATIETRGFETRGETERTAASGFQVAFKRVNSWIMLLLCFMFVFALFSPIITASASSGGYQSTEGLWSYKVSAAWDSQTYASWFEQLWFNRTLWGSPAPALSAPNFVTLIFSLLALFIMQLVVILVVALSSFLKRPGVPVATVLAVASTLLMLYISRIAFAPQAPFGLGFYLWVIATGILTAVDLTFVVLNADKTAESKPFVKLVIAGTFLIAMWAVNAIVSNEVLIAIIQNAVGGTSSAYINRGLIATLVNCAAGVITIMGFFTLNDLNDTTSELCFGAFGWVIWVFMPELRLFIVILLPFLIGFRERFTLNRKNRRAVMLALTLVALAGLCLAYFIPAISSNFAWLSPNTGGASLSNGVQSSTGAVQINAMHLEEQSGVATFSVTIENSGAKSAKSVTVMLATKNAAGIAFPSGVLEPNQTASYTATYSVSGFVCGNSYPVTVAATYTDDSTSSLVQSVTCINPLSAKAHVQIDTMDLVSAGGNVTFSCTINVGNAPATEVDVQLAAESAAYSSIATFQPSATVAFTKYPVGTYIVGNAYIVSITATYTDDSTSSIVASVTCRG